jgi:DNA-binding CsgD family transcriptional regulator
MGRFAERSGRLFLGSARADETLQSVIEAGSATPRNFARGIRMPRAGSARDWQVLIRSLESHTVKTPQRPTFLIQFIGRTRPRLVNHQVLRDLYHLSDSEITVITALLRTASVEKAAQRLSLSRETVRSHLKRIFRKCDVHSQEELMSLLHCLAQFASTA